MVRRAGLWTDSLGLQTSVAGHKKVFLTDLHLDRHGMVTQLLTGDRADLLDGAVNRVAPGKLLRGCNRSEAQRRNHHGECKVVHFSTPFEKGPTRDTNALSLEGLNSTMLLSKHLKYRGTEAMVAPLLRDLYVFLFGTRHHPAKGPQKPVFPSFYTGSSAFFQSL